MLIKREWWLLLAACAVLARGALAQSDTTPAYLRDRGTGMPTSMFGSYVREGELLLYPFFEYYYDHNLEYKPSEFGYGLDQDFRGRYRATEGLFLLAYGLTDWLSIEVEGAVITATLDRAAGDTSGMPPRIRESGLGDVEGQIRARWTRENAHHPEVYSYFEAVAPHHKQRVLIGTPDWELKFGTGVIRGFPWGTITVRAAGEYLLETKKFGLGEYALEYLRRVSPKLRLYLGLEGTQDELSLIPEVQWHFSRSAYLKLNTGIGLTSKALDWTPETGIMFFVPLRTVPNR